jgi:hypothetical protein
MQKYQPVVILKKMKPIVQNLDKPLWVHLRLSAKTFLEANNDG